LQEVGFDFFTFSPPSNTPNKSSNANPPKLNPSNPKPIHISKSLLNAIPSFYLIMDIRLDRSIGRVRRLRMLARVRGGLLMRESFLPFCGFFGMADGGYRFTIV
jgi:hypothetical protein